jgi:hypothetical protein
MLQCSVAKWREQRQNDRVDLYCSVVKYIYKSSQRVCPLGNNCHMDGLDHMYKIFCNKKNDWRWNSNVPWLPALQLLFAVS